MKITIFVAFFLASASAVFAQEGPSYEETLRFLNSKVDLNRGTSTNRLLENDRCDLVLRITNEANYKGRRQDDLINHYFDLSDLDPSRIFYEESSFRPGEGLVWIHTKENRDLIIQEQIFYRESSASPGYTCQSSGECRSRISVSYIVIQTLPPNNDNGPRAARALQHLVRLCGGQEELF
jgi:hypothetical protein